MELLQFAKQKLLNGWSELDSKNPTHHAQTLTYPAIRFALEFNADSNSHAIACKQVENHMQLYIAVMTGFKQLVTIMGLEPLLAKAVLLLLHRSDKNLVQHLAYHLDLNYINHRWCSELVAALIIMQAQDTAIVKANRRWMFISEFIEALLPLSAYNTLQSSLPTL
jgi:hypothetical protein